MKPIVIIQARQSSKRLPNKVILPIKYIPVIEIIYKRVFSKNYKTLVAISTDKSDDLLCSLLKSKKMLTNVGDEGGFAPKLNGTEDALETISNSY